MCAGLWEVQPSRLAREASSVCSRPGLEDQQPWQWLLVGLQLACRPAPGQLLMLLRRAARLATRCVSNAQVQAQAWQHRTPAVSQAATLLLPPASGSGQHLAVSPGAGGSPALTEKCSAALQVPPSLHSLLSCRVSLWCSGCGVAPSRCSLPSASQSTTSLPRPPAGLVAKRKPCLSRPMS